MPRKRDDRPIPPRNETIVQKPMEEVMHESFVPYAEHVILERALPRVEDGLKPVQRRILYTMHELSMTPDKPHRKCARIVGDCLGKYHPHGDSAVYDAMVRMAQSFVMRAPLVDGHGNFGSVDGDSAAAMRYTEARMTPLALELLRDLDKDTVEFSLNFDDTTKEPDTLPSHFPNLLVNGASGIAVGLATNIPPHNLGEAIDAVIERMDRPDCDLARVMAKMPGPDFPTGGYLVGKEGLLEAYRTGRGRVQVRAKVDVEPIAGGKHALVITELPYQVNKQVMLEKILKLTEDKKALFSGIADIRDESDRGGLRAVIECKRDVDPHKMLRMLYKASDLQVTFGINMVAIAEGKPRQLGLLAVLDHYIAHQRTVYTRRTRYELEQARAREHVLAGLMIAVDNLDEVIRLIRASKSVKEARGALCERFALSEIQAQAILDLRLQRLTGLELLALRNEHRQVLAEIDRLLGILGSEAKLFALIKKEMREVRDRYADPRRTVLLDADDGEEVDLTIKAPAEDAVILLSKSGIRRMTPKAFQKREEGEAPARVLYAKTDQRLLLFTDAGNAFLVGVDAVPEQRWKDRPLTLGGLLAGLEEGESVVAAFVPTAEEFAGRELLFATRRGMVKRAELSLFNPRVKRIAACGLKAGDRLLAVHMLGEGEDVLLVTRKAMSICFPASEVSTQGRTAAGVRGIALDPSDEVIACELTHGEGELLTMSERGYGKRSLIVDFEPQGRGGKGLKAFQFHPKGTNGSYLVAAFVVTVPEAVTALQVGGVATPLNTEDFPVEPRFSKAAPLVVALMDQVVEAVERAPAEA